MQTWFALGGPVVMHLSAFRELVEGRLASQPSHSYSAGRLKKISGLLWFCLILLVSSCIPATAQISVYEKGYNNSRTDANLQETILTPSNVNPTNFGKLWTFHTDGQIYNQPLYVANLNINGGQHNVVFVGTMFNTMYALDADTGTVLWSQNYGYPIIAEYVQNNENIDWRTGIGILGTPVIDPTTNIMYFVNGNQPQSGAPQYTYNLNALNITTGQPVNGSPVQINATYSSPGNPTVTFNAKMQGQRPGLVLANGNVYIAFGSHQDQTPYYGWVLAYNKTNLQQVATYADTPVNGWGGIWMAGMAPVVDSAGNLYMSTGNGAIGSTSNGNVEAGSSFLKLSPSLQLLDYFTPSNASNLNSGDMDLGSGGLMLIPNTNYLLGGGKQGVLYLVNTNDMGEFHASGDQVQQEFQAIYGVGTSHIHGTPVYFDSATNGPTVYVWGENDVLRGFTFSQSSGMINTNPFTQSKMTAPVTNNDGAMPGGFLSISANGNSNAILWASTPYNADAVTTTVQGVLYAFDPNNLQTPLWSDKDNDGRDEIGYFGKFSPPMVANGKVYVPTFGPVGTSDGSGALVVYGLLQPTLTVNVASATMTQGATLPTFTGTVTGLKNGDTVGTTITVTYSTTATSSSPAGTYPITATVGGSSAGNYEIVVNPGTLTINPSTQPTLTVTANNATRVYGAANPTFSGTITGAQNGDSFTETFSTTATTTSNVGSYAIVPAANGANLNNYNVVIVNGTLSVTAASTTTTLSAPATATYGSNVTLTATVASTAGTPGGTVTFYSGATALGTGTLNASGVATLSTTTIPVGTSGLTAAYGANGNFAASTSAASSITVNQGSQTITFPAIGSHAYGSAPFAVTATSSAGSGYPVTITVQSGPATISGGTVSLTGAGTVVLLASQAGNNDYSAATATQSFQVTPAPLTVTANNATRAYGAANPTFSGTVTGAVGSDSFTETFTTTATTTSAVGSYPIVPAVTGPQSNYTITIVNGALTVTGAATTTTLSAPGTSTYNSSVALTATVAATGGTPTGTVTFYNGAAVLGTGTLSASGVATLNTTTLPVGTNSITAAYTATGNFGASTSAASVITVSGASQTITFSPIGSHSYGNPPFAVSATSSLGNNYPVTITVQSGPAVISGGTVSLTGAGAVVLLASQAGNGNYTAATATQSFQVAPAPLTVTASNATRVYGAANPAFTGTVTGAVGSDTFTESFSTTATTTSNVGSYPIVPAAAGGNLANYSVKIVNGALTVTGVPTTTSVSAPSTSNFNSSVTLTATVSSTGGTPGGTVTFSSNGTPLGVGTLSGSGAATLSTTALPGGTNSITASYAATGNFAASTSTASIITVNGGTQTITFPSIASRSYGSAPFAVTATSSAGTSYPVAITVQSGPATISGGTVSLTGAGTVTLLATQPGNSSIAAATATQTFQVTPAATTTALTAPGSAASGASVTLTATVTSTAGTPSGTVTFYNGTTALGTGSLNSGVATLSTTALPSGTDQATASYAAAGNFAASVSQPATLIIAPPTGVGASYTMAANPTSLTIKAGGTGSTMLTLTPSGGYKGTVSLSCTNLPSNATCSFAQNQVTLTGNNQNATVGLTIQTASQQSRTQAPARSLSPVFLALAFWWPGGFTGLAVFARKRKLVQPRIAQICLLLVCTLAFAIGLSGCGMSGYVSNPATSQITVVATGTSGAAVSSQTLTISITTM
jgi:hypothetical protein